MYKIYLLWVFILVGMLTVTGCKKDGNNEETTPEEVVVETAKNLQKNATTKGSIAIPENNGSFAIPAPSADFSGIYQSSQAKLNIRKMSPELSRFSIQMNSENECLGNMHGIISMITNNQGEYVEKDCILTFNFSNQLIKINEKGSSCHDHHSDSCSFSDDYRLGDAIKESKQKKIENPNASLAGHYTHKYISSDNTRCKGWEVWLTSNTALDAKAAVYNGSCDSSPIKAENLKYNALTLALDFDILDDNKVLHFIGNFDKNANLHGKFTD